jgi:hypothetical protein
LATYLLTVSRRYKPIRRIPMNTPRKAVALDLVFGARDQFYRFANDLEATPELSVTFVRGSIGNDGAWTRVLVRGSQETVDHVVARWRDSTVAFARLPQAAA